MIKVRWIHVANIKTIGLDIAKGILHFVGVNKSGKIVKKKQLKRWQFCP
jgi:hypothetical protein